MHLIIDAAQLLQGVEHERGGRPQERAGLPGDDAAIGQLQRHRGLAGLLRFGAGGGHHGTVGGRYIQLVHDELLLVDLSRLAEPLTHQAGGGIVPADDLLLGSTTAGIVIYDAVARHIDAHIGRTFVGRGAVNALENGIEHREDLDITVVIDGGDTVGFQVERINHIDIVEVGGGGLIRQVDRVLEGEVPNGKGLKFGISGLDPALIFVEELRKTGGHFATAGAGGRNYHQRAGGFDVFILTKAIIADDERDIGGIIGDDIVAVDLDPQGLQALLEGIGGWLGMVMGDADAAHIQADPTEGIDEAQDIQIVGDTQIAAALVLFDGISADDNDDFCLIL